MTTPRHPLTGQYIAPTSLPTADLVNGQLQSKPNAPDDAACAVPDGLPDHDRAMASGDEAYMNIPPGPDADSKNVGGDDLGFPS